MQERHVQLIIHGTVQGVFFRKHTLQKAGELGIRGFVRNEPDGSVYVEATGDPEALASFVRWCRRGPPGARVAKVDHREIGSRNFSSFEIRYS